MTMPVPAEPKIYHIVHVDRLSSIVANDFLWCDAEIERLDIPGTVIGVSSIKERRRERLLHTRPGLRVGDCVPFYFCPRSVMLYMISRRNHIDLSYRGGQDPIIHLEADLRHTTVWAENNNLRWAFTTSNAGARYFQDYCDLDDLREINWAAMNEQYWQSCKEDRQAEFLLENRFPWYLIERVGVSSRETYRQVNTALQATAHKPQIEVLPDWYY